MADLFKHAGYATGLFGKWHNGSQYPYHPNGRGFEEFVGFCCGHIGEYFATPLEHNGRPVTAEGFLPDFLTERAIEFMHRNRERPFLCWLAWNTPHSPFQVPDRFYDRLDGAPIRLRGALGEKENIGVTRAALALCENLDWNAGRVLSALKDLGIERDTIVVYLSDNGPNSVRWNGGMKGMKGSVDEGGVRVPCFIRWPGHVAPGLRVEPIAAHIDLLPTLADLAGIPLAGARPLDGVSLRPLLEGRGRDWPARRIFSAQGDRVSVRTDRYRADESALYDMTADPGQTRNCAAEHPEEYRELATALRKWKADVLPKGPDTRPYPVGYRAFPSTTLPVQDATLHGRGLVFSSRHPNDAWVTGWTDRNATLQWDVEVVETGRFETSVAYACPAADLGAELELAIGNQTVRATIRDAHDPPVHNSPDRVPREESATKPFRTLSLGTLPMTAGRGTLVLRAASMPGRQVAEIRAVMLRRIN